MREVSPYKSIAKSIRLHRGTVAGAVTGALMGAPTGVIAGATSPGYSDKDDRERRRLRRRNLLLGALTGSAVGAASGYYGDMSRELARLDAAEKRATDALDSIDSINLINPANSMKTSGLLSAVRDFRPFAQNNLNITGGAAGSIAGVGVGSIIGGISGGISGNGVLRGAATGAAIGGTIGGLGGYMTGKSEIPRLLDKIKSNSYEKAHPLKKSLIPESIYGSAFDSRTREATIGDLWENIRNRRTRRRPATPPQPSREQT